jgi:hypothetical protein
MNEYEIHPVVMHAAGEIDQVAKALRAIIEEHPVWSPDSPAAQQIAEESQYANGTSPNPVKHALLTGTAALGMATDHLTAVAAAMRTERTVFAAMSLVRPVLSASGSAYYLLDASLSTRERLRRSWSMHAAAFTEQLALSDPGDPVEKHALRRRNDIRDLAEAAGYTVAHPEWKRLVKNPSRTPPRWKIGDEAYPSEGSLIAAPLSGAAGGTAFGWKLFRMSSMFVHVQPTAVASMVLGTVSNDEPGVARASIGTSLGRTLTFVGAAVLSLRTTALAALQIFGRSAVWWNEELLRIVLRWREIVNADRDIKPLSSFDVQPGEFLRAAGFVLPGY